ncbi:MAG: PilZ domain-containing protein [Sandaracinus sp.]|nr:PilZ domain-containing protein [Myxococcales bacterium]MCB9604459.1 PilZ domain-containing protein [Sandaracinus sp.]MCB9615017.1 PilZ domain-containing protein [Sandaracinus sp.]MCB9622017.1 PilZ domain-containing protein [Sandaracinus sp.]MCB9630775.1 PilZ domain-containing protein [Sandaracinus sp.]
MTYSGAAKAREARESLGQALEALQRDTNIPEDVMAVAQNIAQSVGALFEAERASSEPDGKASVKAALGSLSQTLALLQDVRTQHGGIATATEVLAKTMSLLFPLTTVPSRMPPAAPAPVAQPHIPPAAAVPQVHAAPAMAPAAAPSAPPVRGSVPTPPPATGPRVDVEANIGATTESNFFVGFSGEISDGGVFLSTYEVLKLGSRVRALVTLPGNFEFKVDGWVRFVRDPMDLNSDAEPGMGIQFEHLSAEARDLVLRFIRKRAPLFYDD